MAHTHAHRKRKLSLSSEPSRKRKRSLSSSPIPDAESQNSNHTPRTDKMPARPMDQFILRRFLQRMAHAKLGVLNTTFETISKEFYGFSGVELKNICDEQFDLYKLFEKLTFYYKDHFRYDPDSRCVLATSEDDWSSSRFFSEHNLKLVPQLRNVEPEIVKLWGMNFQKVALTNHKKKLYREYNAYGSSLEAYFPDLGWKRQKKSASSSSRKSLSSCQIGSGSSDSVSTTRLQAAVAELAIRRIDLTTKVMKTLNTHFNGIPPDVSQKLMDMMTRYVDLIQFGEGSKESNMFWIRNRLVGPLRDKFEKWIRSLGDPKLLPQEDMSESIQWILKDVWQHVRKWRRCCKQVLSSEYQMHHHRLPLLRYGE